MDKHPVIVTGDSAQRDAAFEAWAADQDPWFVRRDVERMDVDSVLDVEADLLAIATVLGEVGSGEAAILDEDPWRAKDQAFELWPDRAQRLRQLRLHHLSQGWPADLLPRSADTPARVLGYLLRVRS